jgi:hypothetical protein
MDSWSPEAYTLVEKRDWRELARVQTKNFR